MVETILTPPHPDSLEALLDKPFTGTFHHPRAQRQAQGLVRRIVNVLAVPLQIRLYRAQDIPGRVGPALDLQGIGPIGQDPIRIAMLQEALGDWLDQHEQLAGLLDPESFRQQFRAAYKG
jgi:hypothetical protein